jgi:TRAP-type C4-dicarboxylate transport system permease small subunit
MSTSLPRRLLSIEAVCAALLILLTLTMGAQVVSRYLLAAPFIWADEVVGLAFTWLTFLAAAVTLKHHGHIAFTYFIELFDPRVHRVAQTVISLMVAGVLGVLAVMGVRMTMLVHAQLSAALEWPMSVYYAALPVGAVLMFYDTARQIFALWQVDTQ